MLIRVLKGADSIDEAVGQFYEDPNKYSHSTAPKMDNPVDNAKEAKTQVYYPPVNGPPANTMSGTQAYSPPPSAPPINAMSRPLRRPHTNVVIEAGNVRARDEVRCNLLLVWR